MYNEQKCEHKNLKWFEETQAVVCLDCGYSWYNNPVFEPPMIPTPYPQPMPDYPIYPVVTWTKITDNTND